LEGEAETVCEGRWVAETCDAEWDELKGCDEEREAFCGWEALEEGASLGGHCEKK
jgi:hypothetical protein